MPHALEAHQTTKYYGKIRGVEALNLQVNVGEVFGFVGPNGAGKTTTIRLALGLINPTQGSLQVLGLDSQHDSREVHRRTGYLPAELRMYDELTGMEMLTYSANLRGGVAWSFVEDLKEQLSAELSRPIRTLSTGNRHKLGIINAMMHRPELLILDEPTAGLDPLVQQEFYRLIAQVKTEGRTVFLSSHNLPEVEKICDRVGIIRYGQLATVESVESLKSKALHHLELRFSKPVPPEAFSAITGITNLTIQDCSLTCSITGTMGPLIKIASQFDVIELTSQEPSIEEAFLAYFQEDPPYAS